MIELAVQAYFVHSRASVIHQLIFLTRNQEIDDLVNCYLQNEISFLFSQIFDALLSCDNGQAHKPHGH